MNASHHNPVGGRHSAETAPKMHWLSSGGVLEIRVSNGVMGNYAPVVN